MPQPSSTHSMAKQSEYSGSTRIPEEDDLSILAVKLSTTRTKSMTDKEWKEVQLLEDIYEDNRERENIQGLLPKRVFKEILEGNEQL